MQSAGRGPRGYHTVPHSDAAGPRSEPRGGNTIGSTDGEAEQRTTTKRRKREERTEGSITFKENTVSAMTEVECWGVGDCDWAVASKWISAEQYTFKLNYPTDSLLYPFSFFFVVLLVVCVFRWSCFDRVCLLGRCPDGTFSRQLRRKESKSDKTKQTIPNIKHTIDPSILAAS